VSEVDFAETVAGVLEVEPAELTDDMGPDQLDAWTSTRHIQLVVTLEEAYAVSFSYPEIRDLRTIGELRAVLKAKGAQL
jgi:acyl carrier protein